jgi:hypothetical protein
MVYRLSVAGITFLLGLNREYSFLECSRRFKYTGIQWMRDLTWRLVDDPTLSRHIGDWKPLPLRKVPQKHAWRWKGFSGSIAITFVP